MKNRPVLLLISLLLLCNGIVRAQSFDKLISIKTGEKWWGGKIDDAAKMPFKTGFKTDLLNNNAGNQVQPLLISSLGRIIWSEEAFSFEFLSNAIQIFNATGNIFLDSSGHTLHSAQVGAARKYFPFTGTTPEKMLFSAPQYNTWIELTYNQNQHDILQYAKDIIKNGLTPGVLMIDDTWQTSYGDWRFDCRKFPDPNAMMDSLHSMGFKVMLWVAPFVSMDIPAFRALQGKHAFLERNEILSSDKIRKEVYPIKWWNGVSAVLDLTNPIAHDWFKKQLDDLQKEFHVDGFKFDAGDFNFYPTDGISFKPANGNEQSELFARFGIAYPLNEFRACWKQGGQPLAQRLSDKSHRWADLQKLIPSMLAEGLMGYPYACPDMIGGGQFTSFLDKAKINQELIVRSAQVHALMPMMQFSLAPWRVLDKQNFEAIKKAVAVRKKYTGEILRLVNEAKISGEPIVRSLEYNFPNKGFEMIQDQFMLGEKILVAPMVQDSTSSRTVKLPAGKWKDDLGKIFVGPREIITKVPIDRIPIYTMQ